MAGTGVKQLPDTCGKFSPHLKVKLEFTLVLLSPFLTLVLLIPFLKTLDPDQLVSEAILSGSTLFSSLSKIQIKAEQDKIWEKCYCVVHKIFSMIRAKDNIISKFQSKFIFGCFTCLNVFKGFMLIHTVASYSIFHIYIFTHLVKLYYSKSTS